MFLWRGNAPHTLALAGSEAEISSEWHGAEQVTLRAENLLRVSIDALRVLSWGRGATSIPEGSHSNPARISPHLHGNIPTCCSIEGTTRACDRKPFVQDHPGSAYLVGPFVISSNLAPGEPRSCPGHGPRRAGTTKNDL